MHEKAVMDDLMREIGATAAAEGATCVLAVKVRLGALSHFSVEHFEQHFLDASRGSVAEGARVVAVLGTDTTDPAAQSVLLESVELALADPA